MAEAQTDRSMFTPEFTGSFVFLTEPKEMFNDDGSKKAPKYCVTIPAPHDHKFWVDLDAAIDAVAIARWGEIPKKLVRTRKDGDESEYAEFAGCYTIEAGNDKEVPGLLMIDSTGARGPVLDPKEIYSGARFVAQVRPGTWEYKQPGTTITRKGVSLYLDNVLKVGDGPKLGRVTATAEEAFANYTPEETVEAVATNPLA